MNKLRTHAVSEPETLFGINPNELPVEILDKIKFDKLLEFVRVDPRAKAMVLSKGPKQDIKTFSCIRYIQSYILSDAELLQMYNSYVFTNRNLIDSVLGQYRPNQLVIWNLLDERNRMIEIERWSNGKSSIINNQNIDYETLYNKFPEKCEQTVDRIISRIKPKMWARSEVENLVKKTPPKLYNKVMDKVFSSKNKDLILASLANRHLKPSHVEVALRIYAKKVMYDKVAAPITKANLEALPTVTRLEVIEKMLYSRKILDVDGVKNEDDFRMLLFSALIRHPKRVEGAIERYNRIIGDNK